MSERVYSSLMRHMPSAVRTHSSTSSQAAVMSRLAWNWTLQASQMPA